MKQSTQPVRLTRNARWAFNAIQRHQHPAYPLAEALSDPRCVEVGFLARDWFDLTPAKREEMAKAYAESLTPQLELDGAYIALKSDTNLRWFPKPEVAEAIRAAADPHSAALAASLEPTNGAWRYGR